MRIIITIFLFLTSLFMHQARADNTPVSQQDFKPLIQTGTADVLKIIDPHTILLHDGRVIYLAGLHFPDLAAQNSGRYAVLAKNILEDMLLGQTVNVYQTSQENWGRTNRMGHQIAHLERQSDKIWVQGIMLATGLAQVETDKRNPELAAAMYAIEALARKDSLGVWDDPEFAVQTPDTAGQKLDRFEIVEGKVKAAGLQNNRVYLNFGGDWKTDFTVSISSEDKRDFIKQGIDPLRWNGKALRVRGWVRDYNGPFMEIDHPEAVELLDNSPAPLQPAQ